MSIKELLQDKFDCEWKAVRNGFGWAYESEIGTAQWVSALTPRYDGDDGCSESRLYVYFNDKRPPELILNGKTHIE